MADQESAPVAAPEAKPVPAIPAAPTPEQLQAAIAKLKAPKKICTPTSEVISHRTKEQFAAAIDDLKFDKSANPHPARVSALKAAFKELLDGLPDGDLYDAIHESGGTENGHQITIRITRHKID